jgi:L-threonylcarbamoyladenylate synthase
MSDQIVKAVEILKGGGLVAFPTETVYGLGADATNSAAVERIYLAKGRPNTNPSIVHIADAAQAGRFARVWPPMAAKLAAAFWPGALTLVVQKTDAIVAEATAGLRTVGLRVPAHPLALELLQAFDGPIAAPSANRSGRVSPTTAEHVRSELGDRVDLILDGGRCDVGIESTVLDVTSAQPTILRPGGVSREQIEAIAGPVKLAAGSISNNAAAPSPGMLDVHYRPSAPMFRFEEHQLPAMLKWCADHGDIYAVFLVLSISLNKCIGPRHELIEMPADPTRYAQQIYSTLHAADARGAEMIWVQSPPDKPAWLAVNDRLKRASKPGAL